MQKMNVVFSDQKQVFSQDIVGQIGATLLVAKNIGLNILDFVIVTQEGRNLKDDSLKEILNPFFEKSSDDQFSIFTESEEIKDIRRDEIFDRLTQFAAGPLVIQIHKKMDQSGKCYTRAPTSPLATTWIESSQYSYRLNYRGEILEERDTLKQMNLADILMLNKLVLEFSEQTKKDYEIYWGLRDHEIYILKINPLPSIDKRITVLVDTNLSERYSGVTSPLTYSFVQKIYVKAIKEAAKTMHFSVSRINQLEKVLPTLIQYHDWHLYYDLEGYYSVLGNLPTGEINISEWHHKIGGKVYGVDSTKFINRYRRIEMLQTVWGALKIVFKQEQVFRGLVDELSEKKKELDKEVSSIKTSEEGWQLLHREMIEPHGFGLSVMNDIFITLGLRFINKVLLNKGYKESDLPLLLKTDLELYALRPLEALNHLKRRMTQKSWDILVKESEITSWDDPYGQIYQKLRDNGEGAFAKELEKYIAQFGHHCFEQMKLESLSLSQSPALLVKLLDSFYGDKNPYLGISSKPLTFTLNPWQRRVIQFTRRCLDWRELLRQKQTDYYHSLRILIVKCASLMRAGENHFSDCQLRDFFSLTVEEWLQWSRKELSSDDVIAKIREREVWKHLERSYPEVYFHTDGEPFFHYPIQKSKITQYHGVGASPGEVTGVALVLQHPEEAFLIKDLENRILVTKNVDPAWVYIMVRAKGLVSEQGTVLGHTAIIGRELKLPTVVGVGQITQNIKTGDSLTINGSTGEIFCN